MERVLLQLKRKRERRKLEDWLCKRYRLILPATEHPFEEEFDLAIIDGATLKQLRPQIRAKRKLGKPVVLPFLLVTVRRRGSLPSRNLGPLVDDVILRPVSEKELLA